MNILFIHPGKHIKNLLLIIFLSNKKESSECRNPLKNSSSVQNCICTTIYKMWVSLTEDYYLKMNHLLSSIHFTKLSAQTSQLCVKVLPMQKFGFGIQDKLFKFKFYFLYKQISDPTQTILKLWMWLNKSFSQNFQIL